MKTPITYYGGKQKLVKTILPLIPEHVTYTEPFIGGGAVFFAKPKSEVEVINDTNKSLITFYRVTQTDFTSLEKEVRITLHSRRAHQDATVIYQAPHLFSEVKQAWAVWTLSTQSFSSMLDASWGYDIKKSTTSKKVMNKRDSFTEEYAIRLQDVQIECTDALRIIETRDSQNTFHYVDPPYVNSDCGHYDGYTWDDYELLLKKLATIKGKFLLSSYPSEMLDQFATKHKWHQKQIQMAVTVANKSGRRKAKTEVLTANYII
jgi:DNA adenine methylase